MRGSAWELEIGTERLQDKVNNVWGDDDEIHQVNIHKCGKKKGTKTMYRIEEVVLNSCFSFLHLQKLQFYDGKNVISENVRFCG